VCGSPKVFGQLLPIIAAEHRRGRSAP